MSPRKTRRGKPKSEIVNESISIINDSMRHLESPSTHSRSLRTRRMKEAPQESPKKDLSLNLNESKRPVRRTRLRKTISEVPDSPNTSKAPEKPSRRTGKKSKPEIIDETILPNDLPELPPKKRGRKAKAPETSKSIISESKLSSDSEDAEVATVSSKILPKKSSKSSNRSMKIKNNSPSIVTPESSPITVPLTPHRSTKTPRKSPVNLNSPKTHSSPKRLSKTPRKLSIASGSPPESSLSPRKLLQSPDSAKKPKHPKLLVKTPKVVIRKSRTSRKSPKNLNDEAKKSEIANNMNSPQLILKRITPTPPEDNPTPPRPPMITSRLHSVIKSEMTSSTPREKAREIRRSLNLSSESPLPVSKFYGTGKSPIDESKAPMLEDVTNPLISDDESFELTGVNEVDDSKLEKDDNKTKSFHKNSTYELAEPKTPNLRKKTSADDTYDLEEPRTPALRKRTGKRSLSEMNCDNIDAEEIAPKRMCRVRFTTPEPSSDNEKSTPRVVFRSRSATPSSKLLKKPGSDIGNVTKRRRSNSLSELLKSEDSGRKRSLSVANGEEKEVRWNQKAQNESINRLSKPKLSMTLTDTDKKKKGEIKGNSAKKVPNFAQIHQRKFEKMESLVDAKKRIADRHNTLTSHFGLKIDDKSEKCGKNEAVDNTDAIKNGGFNRFGFKIIDKVDSGTGNKGQNEYNRFGFKMIDKVHSSTGNKGQNEYNRFGVKVRKQEATKIVSQPLSVKIQAKKEEKRMALKGVRSNRRFELLMKSRNMQ